MFDDRRSDELRNVRRIARLLDSQFKVLGFRFGLDPIIGLIPGLGDVLPLAFNAYLLAMGAKLGLPKSALTAMAINSTLDVAIGLIPGIGDFSDVFFKANTRNIEIMERHLSKRQTDDNVIDGDAWHVN
jgi:hypothetical protein